MLNAILREYPDYKVIMIGDKISDLKASVDVGCAFIGAGYGYGEDMFEQQVKGEGFDFVDSPFKIETSIAGYIEGDLD